MRLLRRVPLLLFLLAASPACSAEYPARVVGVSDGDTLTVLAAGDRQVKVRLYGVDAPETGQDFGRRAKQAASELAFGKAVRVRPARVDRYGRTVAEVMLPDGRDLGREIVRRGMAWHFVKYAPADKELASLQAKAKEAKRGLWSQPGAVPPWHWRSGQGVPATTGVVGNQRSMIYHAPNCRGAAAMSEKNRVAFKTAAEAEATGYRRARDCKEPPARRRAGCPAPDQNTFLNTMRNYCFARCGLYNTCGHRFTGSCYEAASRRHAEGVGCEASVEEFRVALTAFKAEMFPDWSDEALIVTRDEAANYCQAVKKRLNAPRLTRPFILTALIGVRKARKRRSVADPEA